MHTARRSMMLRDVYIICVDLNLAVYLCMQMSVLSSSALSKDELDECSLDHRPSSDLLQKPSYVLLKKIHCKNIFVGRVIL